MFKEAVLIPQTITGRFEVEDFAKQMRAGSARSTTSAVKSAGLFRKRGAQLFFLRLRVFLQTPDVDRQLFLE